MKKLVLLLLTFISSAFAMEQAHQQTTASSEIKYTAPKFSNRRELFIIKAKEKATQIGFITFKYDPADKTIGHIYTIEVNEEHRQKGIGFQLSRQAILELKKQGYQKITWLAWNPDEQNMPRAKLEIIYRKMVQKLSAEIACSLEIENWELDRDQAYCTLIFK